MILFWEFHDSRLGSVERIDNAVLLRFSHAYLIQEEQENGKLIRSGWSQILTVQIKQATLLSPAIDEDESLDISSGSLLTDKTSQSGGVFLPLDFAGPTKFHLTLSSGEEIIVERAAITANLIGPRKFMEWLTGPSLVSAD